MKITNKYLMFVGVTLLLASCELDKEMEGQYEVNKMKTLLLKDPT